MHKITAATQIMHALGVVFATHSNLPNGTGRCTRSFTKAGPGRVHRAGKLSFYERCAKFTDKPTHMCVQGYNWYVGPLKSVGWPLRVRAGVAFVKGSYGVYRLKGTI